MRYERDVEQARVVVISNHFIDVPPVFVPHTDPPPPTTIAVRNLTWYIRFAFMKSCNTASANTYYTCHISSNMTQEPPMSDGFSCQVSLSGMSRRRVNPRSFSYQGSVSMSQLQACQLASAQLLSLTFQVSGSMFQLAEFQLSSFNWRVSVVGLQLAGLQLTGVLVFQLYCAQLPKVYDDVS